MDLTGLDTPDNSALSTSPNDDPLIQQLKAYQAQRDGTPVAPQQPQPQQVDPVLQQLQTYQTKRNLLTPDELGRASSPSLAAEIKYQEIGRGAPLNDNEKFAIQAAYNQAAGGNLGTQTFGDVQRQTAEATAKDNTFLQNAGQPLAQGYSALDTGLIGTVAPKYAAQLQNNVNEAYATPEEGSAGQIAGKLGGLAVQTAGIVGSGGLAPTLMAAQGFGDARTLAAQQRASGHDVSKLSEFGNASASALINYFAGNILQKLGGSSGVPFSGIVSRLPAAIESQITGSSGKVLVPYITQSLLKAGIGATDNEIANIASNVAVKMSGVDPTRGAFENSASALATGGLQTVGIHGVETLAHPDVHIGAPIHGEEGTAANEPVFNTKTGQWEAALPDNKLAAQAPAPEAAPTNDVQATGKVVDQPNAELLAPVAEEHQPAAPRELSDGSDFFDEPQHEEVADNRGEENDVPEPGHELPQAAPLADEQQPVPSLADLHKQIADSDELLARIGQNLPKDAAEPLRGRLPNNTDLATGEVEHPLIDLARKQVDASIKPASLPEALSESVADFEKARGVKVVPVDSRNVAGYSHPSQSDAVLLNVRNPEKGFQEILGHEWGHTVMDKYGDLANEFLKKIPQARKEAILSEYRDRYASGKGNAAADEYLAKNANHEVFATILGKAIENDKSSWNKLLRREPGLWDKVKEVGSTILNSFTGKGREINAVRDLLSKNMDIPLRGGKGVERVRQEATEFMAGTKYAPQKATVFPEEFYKTEGQQAPRNYLSIGHKFNGKEELWWRDEDGQIQSAKADRIKGTHIQHGAEDSEFRGRVDNESKQVSVAVADSDHPYYEKRVKALKGQLESKYPGYEIFVADKGGLTPIDEVTSGHLYPTLDKVRNLEDDKSFGEKVKDIYNNATISNGWKFGKAIGDKLRRGLSDSLSDFIDSARLIDKSKSVADVPLEAYIRLHAGVTDRQAGMAKVGLRRIFGDPYTDPKTGEALTREWQLDPVEKAVDRLGNKAPKTQRRKEAFSFTNFATQLGVAESTIERASNKASNKGLNAALSEPLTGIGPGGTGLDDLVTAKDFIDKAKLDPNYDLAKEFLRRYRLTGNAHLDALVQSERISPQTAANIRRSHEFYTDLHRVMEKTGTLDPSQTTGTGVMHKFRGSNRDIDNPYINQQLTTERSYRTAERNYVVKEYVDQAIANLPEKPVKVDKEAGDTISLYRKGEKEIYKVDPMVAEAINGWGKHVTPTAVRALGQVLGAPGRFMMTLTQRNPQFHFNVFLHSLRNRAILSDESGGLRTLSTQLDAFKDPEALKLVQVLGGSFGSKSDVATTRDAYEKITRKALQDIAGDPNAILSLPRKAWNGLDKLGSIAHSTGRVAEYKAQFDAAKQRGMSDQNARTYAAWKARDLMDFAVSGTMVKAINEIAYVPFLNAGFRGLSKHLDMLQTQPKLYAKRMAAFGLLPALIPAAWAASQGPDQWKRYQGIPLVQRIMFDNYMVGNQRFVIPRGTMTSAASMMAELLFQHKLSFSDVIRAMSASSIPNQVGNPLALLPLHGALEAKANYSWFYDRNIIPPDEEGVALNLRKTDGASPLAQALSQLALKAGMELDPRKIEHVMNSDLGDTGSLASTVSRMAQDKGLSTGKKAQMIGGYERTTPGYTDQEVQRAMSTAERLKDSNSPAIGAIKSNLAQAAKAGDVDERQKFVDAARSAADSANQFYDKYSGQLDAVKQLTMEMNSAKQEFESQTTAQARQQWVKANPDKVKLLRQQGEVEKIDTRINELRKVQIAPTVSDRTKNVAAKELDRLYGILGKLTGNG